MNEYVKRLPASLYMVCESPQLVTESGTSYLGKVFLDRQEAIFQAQRECRVCVELQLASSVDSHDLSIP